MRGLSSDIRYALRTVRHGGISTVVAVLSLAVGVGANAAIFSVGHAMLARPLPYAGADRLVMLRSTNPSHGVLWTTAAPANLLDWQAQAKSFEAIAGYRWWSVDLTGGDHSERLRGLFITPEFFNVLAVPLMGKTFDVEAFNPANPQRRRPEIIIGRGLWQRRFGSDARLLGKVVDVNIINLSHVGATPSFVVGVALANVHFPPLSADFNLGVAGIEDSVDFWMPEFRDPTRRDNGDLDVIARLRPGVSLEQAQSEMDTISRNLAVAHPETNDGLSVRVVPLRDHVLGRSRRVLFLLFASTGLVLLVACGNVANLLLARATTRQKEVAIRAALGAARLRILRQFLAESALIALPAGAIGVGLAYGSLALLRPVIPASVPFAQGATVDRSVLLFTLIVASLTALITGIIPALRVSSANPGDAMKLDGRSATAGRGRQRLVAILVASEVAMTLMLLIATGLMVKSANHLWQIDPGFDTQNLLTMTISLPNNKFEWRHNVVFSRQVIGSIEAMPEVRDAAVIQGVPMRAGSFFTSFSIEGRPDTPVDRPSGRIRVVSPGYFGVMNIPILSGRDYDEHDEVGEVGSLPSVIVNRTLAERCWPGQDAVGKRVRMSWRSSPSLIIGVVGDVRYTGLDADAGNEFYLPEGLYPQSAITLLVRTNRDPLALYPDMHRRIVKIDNDAFVFDVKPMTELIAESLAPRRFSTILLSAFAIVALILSLAGIYAVIAHSVAQRTVEIGIRIAMGASPARVTGLMLRYGLLPVMCGMAVGWSGAFGISRSFSAMLFDVEPLDLPTWILVSGSMLAVACIASYLPARRACSVDPTVALRAE
ncbi:MAG TPA: ABC transporter permease [Vicinamibacterales bacterium]|nr:ABC transporter permease [Vicinamibacterales bacterium]